MVPTERPWWVFDRVGGNLLAVFATEAEAQDCLRRLREANPDMPEDEVEVTFEFGGVEPAQEVREAFEANWENSEPAMRYLSGVEPKDSHND